MCVQRKRQKIKKKQLINGINDNDIMTAIIRELTTINKTYEVTSEQVSTLTRRVEAQRVQKAINEATKENKDSDTMKYKQYIQYSKGRRETHTNCKYCENKHEFKVCPAHGKNCSGCGKLNHFEWVYRSQSSQVPKDDNMTLAKTLIIKRWKHKSLTW